MRDEPTEKEKAIGAHFREMRNTSGLSQPKLSKILSSKGVEDMNDHRPISKIETGQSKQYNRFYCILYETAVALGLDTLDGFFDPLPNAKTKEDGDASTASTPSTVGDVMSILFDLAQCLRLDLIQDKETGRVLIGFGGKAPFTNRINEHLEEWFEERKKAIENAQNDPFKTKYNRFLEECRADDVPVEHQAAAVIQEHGKITDVKKGASSVPHSPDCRTRLETVEHETVKVKQYIDEAGNIVELEEEKDSVIDYTSKLFSAAHFLDNIGSGSDDS